MGNCLIGCVAGCGIGALFSISSAAGAPPFQIATVNPDQIAAKETCGKFNGLTPSGCICLGPGTQLRKVSTRVRENQVMCETKTSDNVFVKVHISVQQLVDREMAKEAIYKLADPDSQIESFVSDVVRAHVPQTTLDDLFLAKEEIAQDVQKRLSNAMRSYGYNILKVLVTDVNPDDSVKNAMNMINTQQRNFKAAEEKAEAEKMVAIKAAEAERTSKKLQGEGIARSRKAIVEGLQQAVSGEMKMSPHQVSELLIMTQYLETLDKMSQGPANVIFTPSGTSSTDAAAALATTKLLR